MDVAVLTILKFLGFGIAAVSTIWGLTQRTTYDDDDGRKRLTPAGQVSIALAIGACLLATTSLGFETLVKLDQERQAKRDKEQAEIEAKASADRTAREKRDEVERRNTELLEQRVAAAEILAAAAEQRSFALSEADAARQRDLLLSQSVNTGSQRNLGRIGEALTQIERVLQQIEKLEISVDWELPRNAPGVAEATAAIRALAARVRAGDRAALAAVDMSEVQPGYTAAIQTIWIKEASAAFPTRERDSALWEALWPRGSVSFLAQDSLATTGAAIVAEPMSAGSPLARNGDIRLSLRGDGDRDFFYEIDADTLWLNTKASWSVGTAGTGKLVSIPDLERATMLLDNNAGARPSPSRRSEQARQLRIQLRPRRITITSNGRTYIILPAGVQPFSTAAGYRLFRAGPIGQPAPR